MNTTTIVEELSRNREVFQELLAGLQDELYLWKPAPEKWCLLEVVCHLYDEEREDFRARTRHVLDTPDEPMPMFDPIARVTDHAYLKQDFTEQLEAFLDERSKSMDWLASLQDPQWENAYNHPKLGLMSAKMFLSNWLAHDYLHIRQITRIKFEYLKGQSREDLNYAGDW